MSFLMAGLASGLGEGLVERAQQLREDFLRRENEARDLRDEERAAASRGGSGGGGGGGGGRRGGGGGGGDSDSYRTLPGPLYTAIRNFGEENDFTEAQITAFTAEAERTYGSGNYETATQAWQDVLSRAETATGERETGTGWFDGPRGTETYDTGRYSGSFRSPPVETPQGLGGVPTTPPVAGGGATGFGAAPTEQSSGVSVGGPATPPQPGDIVDGYRFRGGNPADQSNWEPV